MICVLPCCPADVADMLRLLKWIALLGPCKNHDALIVTDASVPAMKALELKALADGIFKEVRMTTNERPVVGWPNGANSLFHAAAKYIFWNVDQFQEPLPPWLWLEPDAIPLKSGWLDSIQQEGMKQWTDIEGKMRYMGHIYANSDPRFPKQLMSGVAVYPWDAYKDFEDRILKSPMAWDVDLAGVMVGNGVHTPLIHHIWGEYNNPPVFSETGVLGTSVFCPEQIAKEAVVFHRNKDHSLIPLLAKRMGIQMELTPEGTGKADVVSLRRAGDIINLLPLLKNRADRNSKPQRIVVHREFADVLEGVTYAVPVIWDGDWEDPMAAAKKHQAQNAQVFGKGLTPDVHHGNFARIAWKQLGATFQRHEPLVFDNRSHARETALAASAFSTDKPKILVKLNGNSSPFGERNWVRDMLSREFSKTAEIVSLDDIKAYRLYDLIGLMDRAQCLVTADTSTLWLAHASTCPSVQFVNGWGFSASPPRGNCLKRLPYSEVVPKWGEVSTVISKTITTSKHGTSKVLVFSDFKPSDPDTKRRQDEAYRTWPELGARLHSFHAKRHSGTVNDRRGMPFVRDMIQSAFDSGDEDIAVITNNDIRFGAGLSKSIDDSCQRYGCWWAYRVNGLSGDQTDQGADTFAMTRSWWHLHEHLFPDFLLGYWWWDDVMVRLMRWSGCREQERLIFHEPHPFTQSPNRTSEIGNLYNERLANEWLGKHWEDRVKP